MHRYQFQTRWELPAAADDAYRVLEDLAGYRDWWPQVRAAVQTGDTAADLMIRSVLPYEIHVHLEQHTRDPIRRLLIAAMTGDIEGRAGWTITALPPRPDGGPVSRIQFDEDVVARSAFLRRMAPLARPAFIANHALMMREGQRGLAQRLAGPNPAPDSGAGGVGGANET
jgi:hypothetical protein